MSISRRTFLASAAAAPLIAIETPAAFTKMFNARERAVLVTAMDEIVPASDGMPAASQVGEGLAYLQRIAYQDASVATEIRNSVAALLALSEQPFDQLPHEDRVRMLQTLEAQKPNEFAHLRDYVYESYYTQPRIWSLIGYEFYPTDHPGPHMEPFDESILDEVRKRPKLYREA
jgi:Gluconate 2-dehydrogenase subunit 3